MPYFLQGSPLSFSCSHQHEEVWSLHPPLEGLPSSQGHNANSSSHPARFSYINPYADSEHRAPYTLPTYPHHRLKPTEVAGRLYLIDQVLAEHPTASIVWPTAVPHFPPTEDPPLSFSGPAEYTPPEYTPQEVAKPILELPNHLRFTEAALFVESPLTMDVPMVAKTLNDYLVVKGPTGLRDLLTSKKIDLVNAATGTKYLQTVPKQMLFFFCGLRNIGRYLRNTPNASTSQQLQLPDGACEYVGLKHVIHWMQSACANPAYCQELRAPKSMYIAISMSRALRVLGLHADAARIDKWIWKVWFNHALTVTQIKKLWLGFPHDSKYNYHAVENIKRTILSQDPTIQQRKAEVMAHLMDPYTDQELKDRVFIEGVNQRYRPETPAQRATRLTSMRETARARESIERNDALLATLENNRVVTPPDPATDAAPGLSGTVSVPTVVVDAVPVNSGHTITHSATDSGAENVDDAAPAVRAATGVTLNQTTDSHLAAGLAVYDEATTALSEFHLSDNESPREDDGGRRNSM